MSCLPSLPDFQLPQSSNVIGVSIIDTTARLGVPSISFIEEHIPGHDIFDVVSYSFLLEHPSGDKLVFDLGVRLDYENLAPAVWEPLKEAMEAGYGTLTVERDVATILEDEGMDLDDINAIIWSHSHVDHSGDPSTFPNSTALIVGPGFKDALVPGYPANPQGQILESDYQSRDLQEVDFDTHENVTNIGPLQAIDYFGDGSFYLINSPGHAFGHMSALARTTPDTFIFLGGDTCHHGGSLRPTQYVPLPKNISPSPFSNPPFRPGSVCPGEVLVNINPHHARDEPFYQQFTEAPDRNVTEVVDSLGKMMEFDARPEVFVVIAHDTTLLDVVDFYPKKANGWKKKGWKEESRWRFLADFKGAVGNDTSCTSCTS